MRASIIIRAYNAERTISRALDSALGQTFSRSDFEIVVINDGSIDKTRDILANYPATDHLRIIHQENIGAVRTANVGFSVSRNPFVTLLDSDDQFKPHFLAQTVPLLHSNPAVDFLSCNYFEEFRGKERPVYAQNVFETVAVGVLYRKSSLQNVGYYNENVLFPEYDLLLRTWGKWRTMHIPDLLFIYHRNFTSLSGDKWEVERALKDLLMRYPDRRAEILQIRSYALPFRTHL